MSTTSDEVSCPVGSTGSGRRTRAIPSALKRAIEKHPGPHAGVATEVSGSLPDGDHRVLQGLFGELAIGEMSPDEREQGLSVASVETFHRTDVTCGDRRQIRHVWIDDIDVGDVDLGVDLGIGNGIGIGIHRVDSGPTNVAVVFVTVTVTVPVTVTVASDAITTLGIPGADIERAGPRRPCDRRIGAGRAVSPCRGSGCRTSRCRGSGCAGPDRAGSD